MNVKRYVTLRCFYVTCRTYVRYVTLRYVTDRNVRINVTLREGGKQALPVICFHCAWWIFVKKSLY